MEGKSKGGELSAETTHLLASPLTFSARAGWLQKPESSILLATTIESFARYGVLSNLTFFLDYWIQMSSERASVVALAVMGSGYLLAVTAGVLADARLGRYKTYTLSLLLQLFGALLLFGSSMSADLLNKRLATWVKVLALTGLCFISLGIAGSYSSAVPLGVDQHRLDGGGVSAAAGFFPRYYFGVNVGAFFGFAIVSFVQLNLGFQYGFAFSCVGFAFALFCLHLGRSQLHLMPPLGSPLRTVWDVVVEAFSRWRQLRSDSPESPQFSDSDNEELAGSLQRVLEEDSVVRTPTTEGWLERAKLSKGGGCADWKVDEVRMLGRLTLLLLTLTVYFAAYSQVRLLIYFYN